MKQIHVKQLFWGRRSNSAQMGGFELQAPKSANMKEEGFVTRRGELSLNFKVTVPTSGLFSVPDTQHNREKLRKMVASSERVEKNEEYNFKTKETDTSERVLKLRATMEIMNDVDIHEDLFVPKTVFTEEEMEVIFKERLKKGKKKKADPKPKKGQTVQETPGPDLTPLTEPAKVNRFANKAPAVGSIS